MVVKSEILLETDAGDGIVILQFNRPERRNALSADLYDAASAALKRHSSVESRTRIIILCGSGRDFCAGMDLTEAIANTRSTQPARRFMVALESCEKIVIAAIHGRCVGIGVTMLLHCDFVFASRDTTLSTPFRALGIPPEFGSSFTFPFFLGQSLTSRMLYGGEVVGAEEWQRTGVVTAVVGDSGDDVARHAVKHARALVDGVEDGVWDCVVGAKRLVKSVHRGQIRRAMQEEFEEIDRSFQSDGARKLLEARVVEMSKRKARM